MRVPPMCGFSRPLRRHTTNTMDRRGRMAIRLSAKSPQRFADRLSKNSTVTHRSSVELSV